MVQAASNSVILAQKKIKSNTKQNKNNQLKNKQTNQDRDEYYFSCRYKNMKIYEMSPVHSFSSVLIIRYFHSSSCVVGRVLYESINIKFVIVN